MHAAVADLCRETITRGGQQTRTLFRAAKMILDPVDERLRMLDAKSHREGLGLEQDFFLRQKPVHITRRMPCRKDHRIAGNFLARGSHHTVDFFLLEKKIDDLRFKAHLATRRNDRCPHRLDHIRQKVRSDVRMRIGQHALGRAVCDKDFIDLRHRPALGRARVQLAIRKCASTAFAEAIVRFFDHPSFTQDRSQIKTPRTRVLATLENDRPQAQLETSQRGKHARRTAADNHHHPRIGCQRRHRPKRF